MTDQGIGWGVVSLGAMAVLSLVAIGAWAYRAHGLTSTIVARWPAQERSEQYAQIDHTAPWSDPWSKVCRIEAATDAERWCRAVPEGTRLERVFELPDGVHVQLDRYEWIVDPIDGHTISPLPR